MHPQGTLQQLKIDQGREDICHVAISHATMMKREADYGLTGSIKEAKMSSNLPVYCLI